MTNKKNCDQIFKVVNGNDCIGKYLYVCERVTSGSRLEYTFNLGFNLNWTFLFCSKQFYSDLGNHYVLGNRHKTRFKRGKNSCCCCSIIIKSKTIHLLALGLVNLIPSFYILKLSFKSK